MSAWSPSNTPGDAHSTAIKSSCYSCAFNEEFSKSTSTESSRWVSVSKCMDWLHRSGICNTKPIQQSVSMWIKCLMTFPLTVKAKREHIWHLNAKPCDSNSINPDPYCCTGQTHYIWGIGMHFMHKSILIMVTLNSEGRGQWTGRGRNEGLITESVQFNLARWHGEQLSTKHRACRVSQLTNSDFNGRDCSRCAYTGASQ